MSSSVPPRNGLLALLGLYWIVLAVGMAYATKGSLIGDSTKPNEGLPYVLAGAALTISLGAFAGPFKRSTGAVKGLMIAYVLVGVFATVLAVIAATSLVDDPKAWRDVTSAVLVMTAVVFLATVTWLIAGAAGYDPAD